MTRPEYIGTNEFKLTLPIAKSYEKTDNDGNVRMYVAGIASGTGLDLDGERMAKAAIDAFKKAIDEGIVTPNGQWGYVPLRSGHRKEWDDVLGWITKADIDQDNNLWIEAELDETSSNARDLFAKLNRGDRPGKPLQLGFSVGGSIKKASREWDASVGRSIRIIEDVVLKEISVVGQPAYPTAYVEALTKSVNWDEVPLTKEEATKELVMTKKDEQVADATNASAPDVTKETVSTETEVTTTEQEGAVSTETAATVTKTTEEVATTDAQQGTETEKSVYYTEDARSIKELIDKMQAQINELLSTSEKSKTEATVETETVEKETKVEKSVEDRVTEAVTAALTAFKTNHLDPLAANVENVTKAVEEIAAQPVDKSFSVRTAKEAESALEKFHSQVSSNRNQSIIGTAVRHALGVE